MPDDRQRTGEQSARADADPGPSTPATQLPDVPVSQQTSGARPDAGAPTQPGDSPPGPWQQPSGWQSAGGRWQPWPDPSKPPLGWPAVSWMTPDYAPYQFATAPAPWPGFWPSMWPIGSVPWGYANPPALPPVLEPPGNFHPPNSRRPTFSLKGRSSPRLYAMGMLLGLPGITALLLYLAGASAGLKPWTGPLPRWLFLEVACIAAAVGLAGWAVSQARQRGADGWRDYHGPSPVLAMGALLGVVTAAEVPLEAGLSAAGIDLNSGLATLALMVIFLGAYAGVVHFLVIRSGALSWRDLVRPARLAPSRDDWSAGGPIPGLTRRPGEAVGAWRLRVSGSRLGDILVPAAMVAPLVIASNVLSAAMLLVLGLRPSDIATPETSTPATGADRVLLFVAVAILAPIGEEIFFRGFATNAWGRSLSHGSAIVRSSLFFAFIHVLNTSTPDVGLFWRAALFNFGARVPVAFVLAWLYVRRRSILASGTLHAGYNGMITIISFLQFSG